MLGDSKVKGSLLNIAHQQTEILLKDIRANKNLSDDEVAKLAAEKVAASPDRQRFTVFYV